MPTRKIAAIKKWIETMGFKLVISHLNNSKYSRINYYSLGNFGIYEAILKSSNKAQAATGATMKFISWNPWGEDFEVTSVKDLSDAYQESLVINPELAM